MTAPLDSDLIPRPKGPTLKMQVLLGWACIVAIGLVLRANDWPFAHALLVTGFAGYSGYALFAMLHLPRLPLPRWTLAIPVALFTGLLLWFAFLGKWRAAEWIWLGGFVVIGFLVYVTNLILFRRRPKG